MRVSRRNLLLGGVALLVAGCAEKVRLTDSRPRPDWPSYPGGTAVRPQSHTGVLVPGSATAPPAQAPVGAAPPAPAAAAASPVASALHAIPRTQWARYAPIPTRLNPMGGVNRITVHHEGWTAVNFSDTTSTAQRLDTIRRNHINGMNAADIGYHFVIDRAGRIWEGRSLAYQGAHVRSNNEHNIGVMLLGNFDSQSPTDPQLSSLCSTVGYLMRQYRVSPRNVHTHQEIVPTACPGRNLQGRFVTMRRNGLA